jgi:triosephosphate isomerase
VSAAGSVPPRPALVAGNWKMNKTNPEAVGLVRELLPALLPTPPCEVVLCPPVTALTEVALLLAGTPVRLGAQNLHWEAGGAYTGEVTGAMLRSAGCAYVIVGHSERRRLFGETDETVARKTRAAHAAGLAPVVCVGETLEERERGETESVVDRQLRAALFDLAPEALAQTVLAYEPVWAIGTGRTATPAQAQAVHAHLRGRLAERFGAPGATVRILYGGSATPETAGTLLAEPDVDGALVGAASLNAATFAAVVRLAGAGGAR